MYFWSHGVGPYNIKNVINAFLNPALKFLILYYTAPLTKLEMDTSSIGTAENRVQDKVSLPPIQLKILSLKSCKYNYVFCNLIGDLKSKISPAPCDKSCCTEHQTPFTRAEGIGHKTSERYIGRETWQQSIMYMYNYDDV